MAVIKILGQRKMCFTGIRAKAKCCLRSGFRQCQPRWSMVKTKEVKQAVGVN